MSSNHDIEEAVNRAYRKCYEAAIREQAESSDPVHQAACENVADEIRDMRPQAFSEKSTTF